MRHHALRGLILTILWVVRLSYDDIRVLYDEVVATSHVELKSGRLVVWICLRIIHLSSKTACDWLIIILYLSDCFALSIEPTYRKIKSH